jgi:hypothetical protein
VHIGVNVPITELRANLVGLRDFVQAASGGPAGMDSNLPRSTSKLCGGSKKPWTQPRNSPLAIEKEVLSCGASTFMRI